MTDQQLYLVIGIPSSIALVGVLINVYFLVDAIRHMKSEAARAGDRPAGRKKH